MAGSSHSYVDTSGSGVWSISCSKDLSDGIVVGVLHRFMVGELEVNKTEIWEPDGKVSRVWFDIINIGGSVAENIRVVHGVDADQDAEPHGDYSTINDTRDGGDFAYSAGPTSNWTIGYGACDTDVEELGHTGWSTDADATLEDYDVRSADDTIHWRHTEDRIEAGDIASFGFLVTIGMDRSEAEDNFDDNRDALCLGSDLGPPPGGDTGLLPPLD
jgi:hypothetical protein